MAFYTETIDHHATSKMAAIRTKLANAFRRIAAAQDRSADVARMQRLSDRQLADMGLTREGIVRHVYRDIYYV